MMLRRDFLKLLGAGGVVLFFGGVSTLTLLNKNSSSASAQSAGSWTLGSSTTTVPIHATLLYNGKVFYIAGSAFHKSSSQGPFEARLLDLNANTETEIPLSEDLFCAGHAQLPNGNILVAGGTLMYDSDLNNCNGKWHGANYAYEFDVPSGKLIKRKSMAAGRWYPTLVTLPDGKIFTVSGFDEYGVVSRLVEIYDPNTQSWTIKYDPTTNATYCVGQGHESSCAGAGSRCYGGTNKGVSPLLGLYPRMHLMPTGLIVTAGQTMPIRSFDPVDGTWITLGSMEMYRHYGTSFLLPLNNIPSEKGKILLVGGSVDSAASATAMCEVIDFDASTSTTPIIRKVASIKYARKYMCPVILPNGKLVIFGGSFQGGTNFVYYPEMFDPVTKTWTTLPPASVPRSYHSVALLLPDGRVWTASSTPSAGVRELRTEIFSPGYCFEPRPTISGTPIVGNYGGNIIIPTPDAANISSVSLVAIQSVTHHYDANQRLIWLQIIRRTGADLTVSAPINANVAPPGYYMIHVLNSGGVPSVAKIIKIPGSTNQDTVSPSQVTGLIATAGSSQIDLAWNVNSEPDLDHYNIYRGTTSGFAVDSTTLIGQSTTNSYSNTGLAASTYYYRVVAVDSSGNIGNPSAEVSATTAADAVETFYDVPSPADAYASLRSGGDIRFGIEAQVSASLIVNKKLVKWIVYLRKVGTPSGNITAVVRRKSDDSIVAVFNTTINAANLSTTFAKKAFTLNTPYVIQPGDRILIEYNGPARIDIERWNSNQFDGGATRRIKYNGTSYGVSNTQDITGTMSSG